MCSRKQDDNPRQLRRLIEELRLETASLRCELQSQQTLQEELASTRADYEALADAVHLVTEDRDKLRQRVAELEAANERLVDMLWGRRTERRQESPDQRHFTFNDDGSPELSVEEQEVISAETQAAEQRSDEELLRRLKARREGRKKKRGPQSFPAHLERRMRKIDLADQDKAGLALLRIDVTERLRFRRPELYVEEIHRYEYVVAGKPAEGVKSAPAPLSIVEGCKYDFSVVAAAIAMKVAFHHPTYRQQDWFAQSGWFPSRSTLNDLFHYGVNTLLPLHDQMWQLLLAEPIVLGDDTRIRVLLRGALSEEEQEQLSGRSSFRQALPGGQPAESAIPGSAWSYAWLYTGLDGMAPYNIFHWSLTHRNSVIDAHLATFDGVFVGDACGANARLEQRSGGRIRHSSCNAHARREFIKAESSAPILASQMLSFYRQLYDVEERANPLDAAGRLELRQRDAVPIWDRIARWLETDQVQRVLPKSALGQAFGYLRNQWQALQVYLSDGRLPIDNDQSEQTIRPLTVGRNNWLFLGHPRAASGRLQLFSIASSAHRHHLVMQDYLEDVLQKLADAKQNHPADLELGSPYLLELLPDRWAATHPHSVCQGRIDERQIVSDRKRERRARQRIEARQRANSATAGQ